MILGDEGHYNGRFPWVTAALVIINVAVYVAQVVIGPAFTLAYALVPAELPMSRELVEAQHQWATGEVRAPDDSPEFVITIHQNPDDALKDYRPTPVLTLFTCLFLHGDIYHLIGNLWFLLVFGRNVECAMNHGLFLAFYLICGAAAGLAQAVSDPASVMPCIGASGAISGIMGAYISIHPFNNIKVWLLLTIFEAPALIVIGIWLVLNYLSAIYSLGRAVNTGGVAYWAHLGGFAAGFVILRILILCLQCKKRIFGPADQPTTSSNSDAADAFATFISVQTVRKMRDQPNSESD